MNSKKLNGYPESVQSLFICKRGLVGVVEGGATATNTNNLQSNTNMEMKIVSKIIHSGALFLFLQICFLGVDFFGKSPGSCPIFRF